MLELTFNSIDNVLGPTRNKEIISIIQNEGGAFLLITKEGYPKGVYRFPGGGIEKGEAPANAIVREAKEEFNREIEIIKDLGKIETRITDKDRALDFESYIFLIKPKTSLCLSEDKEHIGYKWVELSNLPEYIDCMKKLKSDTKSGMNWKDWGSLRVLPLEFIYNNGELLSS